MHRIYSASHSGGRAILAPILLLAGYLFALLALGGALVAQTDFELAPLPPAGNRITDAAGVLSPEEREILEALSQSLEDRKGSQLAIVLVNTTAPQAIEVYALRLAEAWKIGRANIDDGVIILAAIQDRRLRIEVGYGLEGAIPDAAAKRIITDDIAPYFRSREYGAGLEAGMKALIARIDPEALPAPGAIERGENWFLENRGYVDDYFLPIIFGTMLLCALIGIVRRSLIWGLLVPLGVVLVLGALIAFFLHVEHLLIAGFLYFLYAMFFVFVLDRVVNGWLREGGSYSASSSSSYSGSSGGYSSSSGSSFSSGGGFSGGGGSFGGGGASGSW